MNANKLLYIIFFYSVFTFSQNKEDVYFIMNNKKSNKYLIIGELDVLTNYITVYNKKEYDYHQKKVKEAKEKGTFEWDAEGGRDNLNIHVTKLTFVILSKKKITIEPCKFYQLKIVNYNWLLTEGWKQINGKEPDTGKPLSFKDIYFLYKIDKNKYISYKVGVTTVAY
ncbi:hypothetical protein F7018_03430 [Tenacibaculum aiptasiae]|uniref:Uncharacterized protein n=1 Tax=Tenacibaculum aiptasiae TaxID=426481 RepID=A0A7J5AP29_9FLAO|nr:hypothetical protein [Tenacibaculum aiptasiae]KAB1159376.1 hypothetical protein F7018_03430 [Tenacibaculum aiptasiae]